MWAKSVRERPFAVLVAAMAINAGALIGLFTAAPVYEATASVVITADAAAKPGAEPAPDLGQVAARAVTDLRSSDALTPSEGSVLTLVDGSVDESHLLVATATADSRATAESLVRNVGEVARTQIESGTTGVTAKFAGTPAVVSGHTVSAARILGFAGGAGLLALLMINLFTPTARRPAETVAVTPRAHTSPPPSAVGVLRLAPAGDLDDEDDHDEVVVPVRQPPARPSRQTGRERTASIKRLVQEDWVRSGSNVAWTKQQTKAAFERAERKLDATERSGDQGRATRAGTDDRNDDWQRWGFGG